MESGMKWFMVAAGLISCLIVYAAISPEAALETAFGETLKGPLAEVIVRNWGLLITLVGALLIYGAYHLPSRTPALVIGGISKIGFISLVLAQGGRFMPKAMVPVVIDSIIVLLFATYLLRSPKSGAVGDR